MAVKAPPKIYDDKVRLTGKVSKGDVMAFTYWGRVENVAANGLSLDVLDLDNGTKFQVTGTDLIEKAWSANQFLSSETCSRTWAVELLVSAKNVPFTAVFTKKDGEERTIRCRLFGVQEPLMGRSRVQDLDEPVSDRIRQIDHRTLSALILNGCRYIVT